MANRPLRAAATALLLVPFVWTMLLLLEDIRSRPSGRLQLALAGPAEVLPLSPGARFSYQLAPRDEAYRGVQVRVEAGTTARAARLEACLAGRCAETERDVRKPGWIELALPRGEGGWVTLRVVASPGGMVLVAGHGGRPDLRAALGFSWRFPLERARGYFAAAAGADLFWPALVAYGLALLAGLGLAARGMAAGLRGP